MRIVERIINAYNTNGIGEIIRKAFFSCIYKTKGYNTIRDVKKARLECGLSQKQRKTKVIISLTSFPARFPQLYMCLKSLVLQAEKPDKIIVYLGNDTTENMITDEMHSFEKYGIEFKIDHEKNLMPHKKYFYAMQEYPDSIIVTADDDIVYPRDWLSSLYQSYLRYPSAVSARRVHLMKCSRDELLPYNHWEDQCRRITEPSMSLIATGNSGILYPPHCLKKEAFDVDSIKSLCLRADDIWLKCIEVKSGVPVVWVKNWEVSLPEINSSTNERLSDENVFTGSNDEVLRKVMEYLGLEVKDFFESDLDNRRLLL